MADGLKAARSWFHRNRSVLAWSAVAIGLLAFFVLSRMIDIDEYVGTLREWAGEFGPWAPLAYVGLFVVATLLAFPGTPFTIFAVFLFGAGEAFAVMVVATTLSAIAGFTLSRTLLKDALEKRFSENESFADLQEMLQNDHWLVIPFIRLLPVFPFTFNNYALGLSGIGFWRYLFWSEVVMIPMNAVLVLGAGSLYRAMVRGEVSWWLVGGTVAAAIFVGGFGYLARRTLSEA